MQTFDVQTLPSELTVDKAIALWKSAGASAEPLCTATEALYAPGEFHGMPMKVRPPRRRPRI